MGEDELAEDGLMITSGKDTTVTLKLEGPRSAISQVDRNNIMITVQADTQISDEGHYSLYYEVDLPSTVASKLRVVERSVSTIDVDVVQMLSKSVEIRASL